MRTTICPSIIAKDGKLFLAIGTPGGGRIVSTLAQTISAVIDYNLPLQDAIEAPKFYSKASYGNKLYIEARLSDEVLEVLTKLGHEIKNKGKYDLYFGGIHGIMFEGGKMVSGADPRRGGIAKGY
jgi:gamma-glutamyltranspeptidase/glutathione hydrolase